MFYFFVWNQSIPCCAKMIMSPQEQSRTPWLPCAFDFVNKHDSCDSHWPVVIARKRGFLWIPVLSSDGDGRCNLKESSKWKGHTQRLWGCSMVSDPRKPQWMYYCKPWQPAERSRICDVLATTFLILIGLSWIPQNTLWNLKIYKHLKQPSKPAFCHGPYGKHQILLIRTIFQYTVIQACLKQRCMFWWYWPIFDLFDWPNIGSSKLGRHLSCKFNNM